MRVVDLFCGCGGLSKGFEKAGYPIVAGMDNWDPAIQVYEKNFAHPVIKQDLSDIESTVSLVNELSPDMIIGGPPCQDFSSAGKRDEDNGRGCLTVSFAEIVCSVHPEWFVMENVERILKTNKLVTAKRLFREAGYGLTQVILDASLCGVPQKRKRFVLIGRLGEKDGFLNHYIQNHLSPKPMSVFDYVGDSFGIQCYYRHPRSYARRGIFSIYEPSPTIRGVNRPLPKGYQKHEGDPVDSLENIRALTSKERSIIQTFPEDFDWGVKSKTDLEQMIGNAVPVNLGKFVGEVIETYRNDPNPISETLF